MHSIYIFFFFGEPKPHIVTKFNRLFSSFLIILPNLLILVHILTEEIIKKKWSLAVFLILPRFLWNHYHIHMAHANERTSERPFHYNIVNVLLLHCRLYKTRYMLHSWHMRLIYSWIDFIDRKYIIEGGKEGKYKSDEEKGFS